MEKWINNLPQTEYSVTIIAEWTKWDEKCCELILEWSISSIDASAEEVLRLANAILAIEWSKNPQVELSLYKIMKVNIPDLWMECW